MRVALSNEKGGCIDLKVNKDIDLNEKEALKLNIPFNNYVLNVTTINKDMLRK